MKNTTVEDAVAVTNPTPMAIMELAIGEGADIAQLEKLMELQERWEKNEAKKAYDKALAAFKAKKITITKGSKVGYDHKQGGGSTSYSYAPLDKVVEKIGPELARHGLSLTWRTEQDNGSIKVTAVLAHELGHYEETSLHAAPDASGRKNPVQAVGSTISYLERYTALAITGCATSDMDDDGQGAGNVRKGFVEPENHHVPQGQYPGDPNPMPDHSPPDPKEEQLENFLKNCIKHVDKYFDQGIDAILAMKESPEYKNALNSLDPKRRKQLEKHTSDIENELTRGNE